MKSPVALMKSSLVVLCSVAVVGAGLWAVSRNPRGPLPASAQAVGVGLPTSPAAPLSPAVWAANEPGARQGCTFAPGQTLAYALQLSSEGKQVVPQRSDEVALRLRLTAQLQFEVVEARLDGAVLLGRYFGSQLAEAAAFDLQGLATPFMVQVDGACQLVQFARHREASRAGARNQQALLWGTQFRLENASAFHMQDGNGVALGTLERLAGGELRRTLERYETVWSDGARTLYGVAGVRLGEGPWFESFSSNERSSGGLTQNEATVSLGRLPGTAVAFTAAERDPGQYLWENLLPPARRADLVTRPFTSHDRARQQKVAGLTQAEAVDGFARRVEGGVGTQSTWPDLSAYFEVHPEAVRPAVKRYLGKGLPSKAAGDFFLALSKARTPEARAVLYELKHDASAQRMDRVRSMFALVGRPDVGVELAHELAHDITHLATTDEEERRFLTTEALFALSMMSGSRDDAAVASVASQTVQLVLHQQASDRHLRRAALHAIGNLGDSTLLPVVQPFIDSTDVDARRAAAGALSRMSPADTEATVLAWLARETHPFVQRELYLVIDQQHFDQGVGASPALVEQALRDLRTIKSAYTRRSIVRLIARSSVSKEPRIRAALVAQAKEERARHTTLLNEFAAFLSDDERAEVLR